MAKRVQIIRTDDFDGSEAAETIGFSIDGARYTIDLSAANAATMRETFARYIAAGERVRGAGRRGPRGRERQSGSDAPRIRAWAAAQGMEVASRGRVSAELRDAYLRAHR